MSESGKKQDHRYLALRAGLSQLSSEQIRRIMDHVESGEPIVLDRYNYDPETCTWCPLAIGLSVSEVARQRDLISGMTDTKAKALILEVGRSYNADFSLNPMKGIPGKFFRDERENDLRRVCREIMEERTSGLDRV